MKTFKIIMQVVVVLALVGSIGVNALTINLLKERDRQINKFQVQLENLTETIEALSKSKTYGITLAPNIVNKNTTAFGKMQNLTIQYYFTMDGNRIEVTPDSVYTIIKKELK